ncbi:MAG: lysine-2,3-aminomutase-like protein [Rhodospirillum sp.]|nr:lysine-2,3-aminomutase-like protein [Rhodospirillum sp.]MCF8489108.1 lysine-2,3-aminomutase-like protein [Rhodospirillum sp.]MCF8498898.1 lysine-2,3-aminomutase-like protein [Rhodospirillum sp.]
MSRDTTIRTLDALETLGLLSGDKVSVLAPVVDRYALAIPSALAKVLRAQGPDTPLARQFLPDARELVTTPDELDEPIGDGAHAPVKGVVHRYPDRVLVKPLHACPVYCRFCFRREQVGPGGEVLASDDWAAVLDYIRATPAVREVILSGGDPLMLSPRRLGGLLDDLEGIRHVRTLRIHSRVPVLDPERITPDMLAVLRRKTPVWLVIHANHPEEFTPAAEAAVASLVDRGIPLLSQTVLLRGVNADLDTLSALMRRFVDNRIKPYYLHHPDRAKGTSHFRLSLAEGKALANALRRSISGLCQPTYVLDGPEGQGKWPV